MFTHYDCLLCQLFIMCAHVGCLQQNLHVPVTRMMVWQHISRCWSCRSSGAKCGIELPMVQRMHQHACPTISTRLCYGSLWRWAGHKEEVNKFCVGWNWRFGRPISIRKRRRAKGYHHTQEKERERKLAKELISKAAAKPYVQHKCVERSVKKQKPGYTPGICYSHNHRRVRDPVVVMCRTVFGKQSYPQ